MIFENWLYTGLLKIKTKYCSPLDKKINTDCLVIGGGFTGLHAALRLAESGKKVVLLEKRICGGSASGRSGGFLTPESEENLKDLISKVGVKKARIITNIPIEGIKLILRTIKKYKFDCDLRKQDSLFLSISKSHDEQILEEAETRKKMNLPYKVHAKKDLQFIHPGKGYSLGIQYPNSYGINSLAYTQELKNILLKKRVKIYEDSEVKKLINNTAVTHLGSVKAKHVLVCIDKMKTEFNQEVSNKVYHLQTYLAVSEPLSKEEVKFIFPKKEMMCWDSKLDYMHYRLIEGNRILLGGSSFFTSYLPRYYNSPIVINKVIKEFKQHFPSLSHINFTHFWSGLLDVTKDLSPIADYDPRNKSIQYALGCAGLPWAAFCGDYLARRIISKNTEDLSSFLGINRKFFVPDFLHSLFGKPASFALSHLYSIYKSKK
ncbi:MAG: FAD-binding oxidoreductase [Nanoarchaeota archaeon]